MDYPFEERNCHKVLGRFGSYSILLLFYFLYIIFMYFIDFQVFAVIGGQFEVGDEICGIVISIRYQEDIISVWNRHATNKHARDVIQ